jgi:Arc/MetJ family transcription regulator
MPTNLILDDSLIEEAVKVGNHRTKREAVTAALQEYVQTRKRREILAWVGKVDYDDDYDPKRLRDRKHQDRPGRHYHLVARLAAACPPTLF